MLAVILWSSGLTLMAREAIVNNDYSMTGTILMGLGTLAY